MAKKEMFTWMGSKFETLNISESVGKGGANKTGDVMLIQAMLQYLAVAPQTPKFIGLNSADEVPEPSGEFDGKTAHAIKSYQRKYIRELLKADGIIHPASYENRNLKRAKPLMSITLLHIHLFDGAIGHNDDNHFKGLVRVVPQLLPWIQNF